MTLKEGDKVLLKEVKFPLGSTLVITGNNGAGKSTLLRHIFNRGEGIIMSPKAVTGFYEQKGYCLPRAGLRWSTWISALPISNICAVLHAMNFSGNDLG